MKRLVLLYVIPAISACATQAAISNLTTDQVVVDAAGDDMSTVRQTASQGCAVHKRVAVPISSACFDQWCIQRRFLFACTIPDAPPSTPQAVEQPTKPMPPADTSGRVYGPDEKVNCAFQKLDGETVVFPAKTCRAGGGRITGPAIPKT